MNVIEKIKELIFSQIQSIFKLEQSQLKNIEVSLITDDSKQQFGDMTTNAAMVLARELKKNPRELAQNLIKSVEHEYIEKLELAGPGFVNIFLSAKALKQLALELYVQKDKFYQTETCPKINYNVEFVSANPTGPLHLGHGRGGIIGDVFGNVIRFLSDQATKEFYINDAGSQIQKLGHSFKVRCLQNLGETAELPEEGYQGQYLVELAEKFVKQHGNKLKEYPDEIFARYAKEQMLKNIENTLKKYGIHFDVWFSEKTLHDDGSIEKALELLKSKNFTYEKEGAVWFKSTEFADDKDRVLKKQNGELTYVAADIAYLQNKFARGYNKLVMVLGQDHHSYVTRLKGICQALGYDPEKLHIILYQLVTLKESGTVLKMSKRKGRGITLEDVIDEVGTDVARFFYLNRKADAHLEFDIDLALKHTEENPVYYVQYAYVRTKSILNKAKEIDSLKNINEHDLKNLESEKGLLKKIVHLKDILEVIEATYQTHLLTYYTIELCQTFHSYYAQHKVIDEKDILTSRTRLAMMQLLSENLKRCFNILGISSPESM
ncbi:arginine--tRNA ligase [Candidatus Dependentiae bacterium]|nr:arginine--tRNA ligase [Candidatus Dependentiae bacterium]